MTGISADPTTVFPSPVSPTSASEMDNAWELQPRRASVRSAPVLAVDGFEGPLDWLVEQVRNGRIDLARLSFVDLIDAFVAAFEDALAQPATTAVLLTEWADWTVQAADLTLLRSRLLLPPNQDEGARAQNDAEALRVTLARRAGIADSADWLERQPQLGRDVFSRGSREAGQGRARAGERDMTVTELFRAILKILQLPADAAERYRVPQPPFWTMADAIARITELLPGFGVDGAPLKTFLPPIPADAPDRPHRARLAVAATFTGGLELARSGRVDFVAADGLGVTLRPTAIGAGPP